MSKKTRIIKNCEVCKKEFQAHLFSIKNGHARFCSLTCKGIALRVEKKDNCICVKCQKSFYKAPYKIKQGYGKFCSKPCAHKDRIASKETRKKQSIAKDRGLTPLNLKVRRCFEYKFWRSTIFLRDDFTCQHCGIRGGEIQADHIKSLALIIQENNIKTFKEAQSCVELWDIRNGRTLCRNCHTKTPTWGVNIALGIKRNEIINI